MRIGINPDILIPKEKESTTKEELLSSYDKEGTISFCKIKAGECLLPSLDGTHYILAPPNFDKITLEEYNKWLAEIKSR